MNTHILVSSAVIVFGDKLRLSSILCEKYSLVRRTLGDYAFDKRQIGRSYKNALS